MSGDVLPYSDPLLELLKDPNLNKERDKAQVLVKYIEEIKDSTLKAWCIEAFEILRDLEKIEVKINNWEFQTLDFNISVDSVMLNEQDVKRRKFNLQVAKRVARHCLDFHKILGRLGVEIDELSSFSKRLSPLQKISDPGTILTELNLRVIKIQSVLADQISIHYSRARLVNIGISLEDLVHSNEDDSETKGSINNDTLRNYKQFVNNLLQQLNATVRSGDTIGAMECISIVNDVEKMFNSMKAQREQQRQKKILDRQEEERKIRQTERDRAHQIKEDELREELKREQQKRKYNVESEFKQAARSQGIPSPPNSSNVGKHARHISSFSSGNESIDSDEDIDMSEADSTLSSFDVDGRRKRRMNNDNIPVNLEDSILHRTTLTEKLPDLLSAFDEARAAESGLKKVVSKAASGNKSMPTQTVSVKSEEKDNSELNNTSGESTRNEKGQLDSENGQKVYTESIPRPLPGPSILKAFFQPVIKKPIFIDSNMQSHPLDGSVLQLQSLGRKRVKRLTGADVQKRLLKYKKDEQLKELTLSTKKLTSIQVGSGRVKETVKEIEQQLPRSPTSPTENSDRDTSKNEADTSNVKSSPVKNATGLTAPDGSNLPDIQFPVFNMNNDDTMVSEESSMDDSVD